MKELKTIFLFYPYMVIFEKKGNVYKGKFNHKKLRISEGT